MATHLALCMVGGGYQGKFSLFQNRWNNHVGVQAGRRSTCKEDNVQCVLWLNLPHHCPRLVLRAAGWAPAKGSRASGSPARQISSSALGCFGEMQVLFWAMLALCQMLRAHPFCQTNRVIAICPCAPPSSVDAFTSLNICSGCLCLLESASTDLKVAHNAEPIQK